MKFKLTVMLTALTCLFSTCAMADIAKEKIYLVQMLNQLDSLKPLIIAAEKEQPRNTRIKFHYIAYQDANGHQHNGLLEDINEIKIGIIAKLNNIQNDTRHFHAIKGDYFDSTRSTYAK